MTLRFAPSFPQLHRYYYDDGVLQKGTSLFWNSGGHFYFGLTGTCLAFEVVYGEVAKGNELVAGSNGRAEWTNGPSPNCCSWMR